MKRTFALLLVTAMLVCILPVFSVFAANPEVPSAKMNGTVMTGATASGNKNWDNTADGLKNTEGGSIFVFDQEFKAGTIEWTMTTGSGDKGVIFGLDGDSMDFWENDPKYYFVFVTGGGEMIIAKAGDGLGWTWMKSRGIEGFQADSTINMKVIYDGNGHIDVYANGKRIYDFCDGKPLTGTRVGLRSNDANTTFSNIKITTANAGSNGVEGGISLPFAKVGDKMLTGYVSGSPWSGDGLRYTIKDDMLIHDDWGTTFIVDNDTLPLNNGSISGTVMPQMRSNFNDNDMIGLVFGLEAEKNVTVWKNSKYTPEYYVLFVCQGSIDGNYKATSKITRLVLAKGGTVEGDDNLTVLAEALLADDFIYDNTAVNLKAEFKNVNGKLEIKGYFDGQQKLTYTDSEPLNGTRYGFMSTAGGSKLTALVPVNNYSVNTGDSTLLTAVVAAVALMGTGITVIKKRKCA